VAGLLVPGGEDGQMQVTNLFCSQLFPDVVFSTLIFRQGMIQASSELVLLVPSYLSSVAGI
jgi:hypothetical protein